MRTLTGLMLVMFIALPAWTQAAPAAPPSPAAAQPPEASQGFVAVQSVDGIELRDALPAGLAGQAVAFPFGARELNLKAAVYVPSYYDSTRAWPVLLEGCEPHGLSRSLDWFRDEAERHGFLLVVVEYLYHRGEVESRHDVWTREGGGSIKRLSRPTNEIIADMVVDERNIVSLLVELQRKYNVDRRAVGVTGFLGSGLLAYRLPMDKSNLFCATIARSGGFSQVLMPTAWAGAVGVPYYIIYGEKEDAVTMTGTDQAMIFLKSHHFKKVVAEKIPNSGVDSRPDIAANYFRSEVDTVTGAERAAFDRVAHRVGRLLTGHEDLDRPGAAGSPSSPAGLLGDLQTFLDKYPATALRGQVRWLAAQLTLEKLNDAAKGEAVLREFTAAPLSESDAAPAALLRLGELLAQHADRAAEARTWLRIVADRKSAPEDLRARAAEALKRLSPETK
jgi:dienelactone hydrolase